MQPPKILAQSRDDLIDLDISINYQTQSSLWERGRDSDDYVLQVSAEISGYTHLSADKPEPREIKLGKLSFYIIRVGNAINDRYPLFDLFDVLQEIADAAAAVFLPDFSDFQSIVRSKFPDALCCGDFLLLHRLEIYPFAREQRLGLAIIDRAIRDWSSGCSLAVLKPFPLQFESVGQNSKSSGNQFSKQFLTSERESFRRLRMYYEQLGFERIGRSRFYALCPSDVQPSAKELGLPDSIRVSRNVLEALTGGPGANK